jgi:hypothetical protein
MMSMLVCCSVRDDSFNMIVQFDEVSPSTQLSVDLPIDTNAPLLFCKSVYRR